MKDLKGFIKTTIREFLNENVEFLLDKESDEYNHITNDYGIKDISKIDSDIVKFSKEAIETFKNKVDFLKLRLISQN